MRKMIVLGVVVLATTAAVLMATARSRSAGPPEPATTPGSQQSFLVADAQGRPVTCNGKPLRVSAKQLLAPPPAPGTPGSTGPAVGETHTVDVENGVTVEHVTGTFRAHWGCGPGGKAALLQAVGP